MSVSTLWGPLSLFSQWGEPCRSTQESSGLKQAPAGRGVGLRLGHQDNSSEEHGYYILFTAMATGRIMLCHLEVRGLERHWFPLAAYVLCNLHRKNSHHTAFQIYLRPPKWHCEPIRWYGVPRWGIPAVKSSCHAFVHFGAFVHVNS